MTKKQEAALVRDFEEMYKYYHGWHFAYEHSGYFVYHQMGGELSVAFTPDFNGPGQVSVQIQTSDGQTIEAENISYSPPISAYSLFKIVRPYLDANSKW